MSGEDALFRTLFSMLILAIVLGNSLAVLVILKSRSKTRMNYLLLNLAVADLTAGVFHVPPSILEGTFTYPRGLSGALVCGLLTSAYLTWTSLLSSVSTLVLIAFDRYYAIMKPLSMRQKATPKKLKLFIPVCWAICAVLAIPTIFFREFDKDERVCRLNWETLLSKIYILFWLLVLGIFPTGIMIVLYSRVIRRLWLEKDPNAATLQAVRRSRKKVTKTMLLISAIYVLCWFPDLLRHVLEGYFPGRFSFTSALTNTLHSIVLLNCTVNPVIYAFQFERFRSGLGKIFWCGRRQQRVYVAHRARSENLEDNGQVYLQMRRRGGTE